MSNNAGAILLRVAAELFNRSSRIKTYLGQIGPGETGEHEQLIHTIKDALKKIEQAIIKTITDMRKLPIIAEQGLPEGQLRQLFNDLKRFSKWFTTIHELLVYLPRQPVTTETADVLKASFGKSHDKERPSIILGSLFNALEFDFFQLLKVRLPDLKEIIIEEMRNIVLQLPICDRESPAAWAVLGHELGHAIDDHNRISHKVASKFVKAPKSEWFRIVENWCKELCADLLGAQALGPAPMAALLSLEYCVYPLRPVYHWAYVDHTTRTVRVRSHPPTKWRLDAVSDYLKRTYNGDDSLREERDFYKCAWDYSIEKAVPDLQQRAKIKSDDQRIFKGWIKPLAAEIEKYIPRLGLPEHTVKAKSVGRCLKRLRSGLPIGAQGQERELLRRELKSYRLNALSTDAHRADEFKNLVCKFKEDAMTIPAIITSSCRFRFETIAGAIGGQDSLADKEAVSRLCGALDKMDWLVAGSIRSSTVHNNLRHRLGFSGTG